MKGAIIGDIIGSAYINKPIKANDFQLLLPESAYTDDTILTISTADALLNKHSFASSLRKWVREFPTAGYREEFINWVMSEKENVYMSQGDGAARRISPIGLFAHSLDEAMQLAEASTIITHNIPLKIKASKAVAGAIFLAKTNCSKEEIKQFAEGVFEFQLSALKAVKSPCCIEESPVPAALVAFLQSDSYESAIKNALLPGGPTNTLASIAGGIAHAYYRHIPKSIIRKALARLHPEMGAFIEHFENIYFPKEQQSQESVMSLL